MRPLSASETEFHNLAGLLSDRVSALLSAPVVIVDERNTVLARSQPQGTDLSPDQLAWEDPARCLNVPFQLNGRSGQVVVGPSTTGEEISRRLANAAIDLLVDEAAVVERFRDQHKVKDKLIHDILHGHLKDEGMLLHQARFLGMDLTPPRAVLLIDATEYVLASGDGQRSAVDDKQVQRQAQSVIDRVVSFFHLPNDTICGYVGDGEIAVLKASNTKNLTSWADSADALDDANSWANLRALKRAGSALLARLHSETGAPISIGIGRFHPGLNGLAESYQDAKVALSLGRRFHGRNRVHCLDELGIAAFVGVSDEQTKIDLAMHLLSPLDHEPEILETLKAFLEHNCSPSITAQQLSIHRNTLRYRLDKAASLSGLDPRRFDDAVLIRLSLLLRSLGSDVAEPDRELTADSAPTTN